MSDSIELFEKGGFNFSNGTSIPNLRDQWPQYPVRVKLHQRASQNERKQNKVTKFDLE